MPATLPKQTVIAGSTVEMKATDSTGAKYNWCVFGISSPDHINPHPNFLTVDNYKNDNMVVKINGSTYNSRVSFVGDLNIGKAWFRITDVKVADSKTYKIRCFGTSGEFYYPKMELEVSPGKLDFKRENLELLKIVHSHSKGR